MTDVYTIIYKYKQLKGYESIENWDKLYLKRWLTPSRNMLGVSSLNVVIIYLDTFKDYKGYWDLWTAEKRFPDYLVKNKNVVTTAENSIDKLMRSIQEK